MASEPADDTPDGPSTTRPAIVAHRGFAGVYPQNTVTAVERAATEARVEPGGSPGADAVEIDVMPAACGEVVVFHDYYPGRLTDAPPDLAERPIWEVPYDELAELSVLGSDQSIPRLADVLAAIPGDVTVNVEFKNPGLAGVRVGHRLDETTFERHERHWRAFAREVLSIRSSFPHEVLVSSFHEPAIAAVRAESPDVPLAYVLDGSIREGLAVARRYDCEAVHPPMEMIAGTPLFDAKAYGDEAEVDLVERAHAEGRLVNVWTIDNWYEASHLCRAGVDGLIADYPGVLAYGKLGPVTG